MAYTEAHRKAQVAYQKTLDSFSMRLKPEVMNKYKEAAETAGMKFRSFVLLSMDEYIKNHLEKK